MITLPTPPSAAALPQTGQAARSPPPQHGKAAPRVGVRGCRAFIHTRSRHDTGVQDGVGLSSGQKVPFMRPWHGLVRGSGRTG